MSENQVALIDGTDALAWVIIYPNRDRGGNRSRGGNRNRLCNRNRNCRWRGSGGR